MDKDFDSWNALKKKLNSIESPPFFNEREVWWCAMGINIGSEIYGKGKLYSRPVLIFKKFNRLNFLGIPLSTKLKNSIGYHKFTFKEKEICASLGEIRKLDGRRLFDKMGMLSENKFDDIKAAIRSLIFNPR